MRINSTSTILEGERGWSCSHRVLSGWPAGGPDLPRSVLFQSGFTMVEIAICLAIIGFALVAIIGVLPTGMQVQRENREETIINQDGVYFMEAIRSGSRGLDDLTNYVTEIWVTELGPNDTQGARVPCPLKIISGTNIIGALSTPYGAICAPDCDPPNGRQVYRTDARVRSISGSAVEKGDLETLTFEYWLSSEIRQFSAMDTNYTALPRALNLNTNLYEIRLTFRWPVLANGNAGNGRKVFRSMLSGSVNSNLHGYFFDAGRYNPAEVPVAATTP